MKFRVTVEESTARRPYRAIFQDGVLVQEADLERGLRSAGWTSVDSTGEEEEFARSAAFPHAGGTKTTPPEDLKAAEKAARSVFGVVVAEDLEDGTTVPFTSRLLSLVRKHGAEAVMEIASTIESPSVDPQVASWALRWLGRIRDPQSRLVCRWLLERSLRSRSPIVRDGAALGLASLRDPHAIPHLQAAIERERSPALRRDLEQVLRQVERFA